jgi:hypothetical protein
MDLSAGPDPGELVSWLETNLVEVLNVAGPRESGEPGIQVRAREFLLWALMETPAASPE